MQGIQEKLHSLGFKITPAFGQGFVREGSEWFKGHSAGDALVAVFGDWATGEKHFWQSGEPTPETTAAIETLRQEEESERRKRQEEVKEEARALWEQATDRGSHPYLEAKGLRALHGARITVKGGHPVLLVPMRDEEGTLFNLTRIYSQSFGDRGNKFLLPGGRKKGLYHTVQAGEGPALLCEGFSTAATVAMALPEREVVCCFDAGNLVAVAACFRGRGKPFEVCADNDRWKPENTGVKAAREACQGGGGKVWLPSPAEPGTDFNDLYLSQGLDAVQAVFRGAPHDFEAGTGAKEATPPGKAEETKPVKVSEDMLARAFLKRHPRPLIRQGKSVFEYRSTHWVELEDWDIDQLKNEINGMCSNALDTKKLNSVFIAATRRMDHVPEGVNLFTPNPSCGNFLDGTLRLSRDAGTGQYALSFSAHRPEDWVTWVVPVRYQCDRTLKNSRFEALLKEALEGEPDAEGMLRALKQMGGAMLVPTFPQMFFLHGVSGSRKSTIALSLAKLLDERNVSSCDPANMENHQIEGMMGKLVNMHTDIEDRAPLPRGFIKRFEDNSPVQVNRKGKPVVRAKLPSVHVYCANTLPPNFEGQGKAFQRRVTLLEFKRDLTHGDEHAAKRIVRYEDVVWGAGYEGLLNWCLEGLDDLVRAGGKFFQPNSSREAIQDWQAEKDPVEQFMRGVRAGEVLEENSVVMLGDARRIKTTALWACFQVFHNAVYLCHPRISRYKFYSEMKQRGYKPHPSKGADYFHGIGVHEVANSKY